LFQPLANRPGMQRLKGNDFKKKEIQRALDQTGWLADGFPSVTEARVSSFPSVSKGGCGGGQVGQGPPTARP
jgi:hypothetical protein